MGESVAGGEAEGQAVQSLAIPAQTFPVLILQRMVDVEDFKLAAVYIWKDHPGFAWGKETEGGRRGEVGAPNRKLPSTWDFEDNPGVTELTKESDQNKGTSPVVVVKALCSKHRGQGFNPLAGN